MLKATDLKATTLYYNLFSYLHKSHIKESHKNLSSARKHSRNKTIKPDLLLDSVIPDQDVQSMSAKK